jgi:two-component system copper resistance phosphate regulon response regulator CusR
MGLVRILLVEDEARVASFVARGLREQSYAVDVAMDAAEALYQTAINQYDLVILDVMLPARDGLSVCRELREKDFRSPILMLTARDAVDDRVCGLDAGADDYLVKPFDFKELLARLRALSRRSTPPRPAIVRIADLLIDSASHCVSRAGRPINLTAKEYALLEYLALHEDRVVSREEIGEHVWDDAFDPLTNIIDVYIKRLRTKLAGDPPLIHTRRGEGYLFSADPGTGS